MTLPQRLKQHADRIADQMSDEFLNQIDRRAKQRIAGTEHPFDRMTIEQKCRYLGLYDDTAIDWRFFADALLSPFGIDVYQGRSYTQWLISQNQQTIEVHSARMVCEFIGGIPPAAEILECFGLGEHASSFMQAQIYKGRIALMAYNETFWAIAGIRVQPSHEGYEIYQDSTPELYQIA